MIINRLRILMLILVLISIGACDKTPQDTCNGLDKQEIESAITNFVKKGSVQAYKIKIYSNSCVNDFALVRIFPIEPVTDPAYVYLHKINNHWEVMTLGTHFDEDYLQQVPEELRNYGGLGRT